MNYKLFLPIMLLCSSFSANAEERWFEVEVLLFQRNISLEKIAEKLSDDLIAVDTSSSTSMLKVNAMDEPNPVIISAQQYDHNANNFILLDSSHLQLSAQREKLAAHAAFKPVLHMAWQMPVKSNNDAKPIRLFGGENLALGTQSGNKWAIDGNFKIYLDHYLFIDTQFIVSQKTVQEQIKRQPADEQDSNSLESENIVEIISLKRDSDTFINEPEMVIKEALFDQRRRLRSEEIHYLDHPLMGIIVQIRKIEEK
ncbi:peptidoglycan binding protein CsiV [Psychromonas sp. MB-3u-54]|uniref:peptidoglycan binding protein CsiV n=1 Tax=Psychromonas sp. MB-3u-54 TaxID=2058319 RepID=UPI0012FEAC1A|nr:peptidoglycan binding protein CsiV [Psychromonas sp. MB-3u-54]